MIVMSSKYDRYRGSSRLRRRRLSELRRAHPHRRFRIHKACALSPARLEVRCGWGFFRMWRPLGSKWCSR